MTLLAKVFDAHFYPIKWTKLIKLINADAYQQCMV